MEFYECARCNVQSERILSDEDDMYCGTCDYMSECGYTALEIIEEVREALADGGPLLEVQAVISQLNHAHHFVQEAIR